MNAATHITNLLYRYGELIDCGDLDGAAALFARAQVKLGPDLEISGDTLPGQLREQVRIYPCGTPRTRHVISNVIVEIDYELGVATVRSSYTVLQQTDRLPLQPICAGRYLDKLICDHGQWHFSNREYTLDLIGDLSEHLLPAAWSASN